MSPPLDGVILHARTFFWRPHGATRSGSGRTSNPGSRGAAPDGAACRLAVQPREARSRGDPGPRPETLGRVLYRRARPARFRRVPGNDDEGRLRISPLQHRSSLPRADRRVRERDRPARDAPFRVRGGDPRRSPARARASAQRRGPDRLRRTAARGLPDRGRVPRSGRSSPRDLLLPRPGRQRRPRAPARGMARRDLARGRNPASGAGTGHDLARTMTGSSPVVRGMLWMALTGFIFILLNAIMKKLSHELDPWLVGFLRYLLGALVMLAPALRLGKRALHSNAPKLQFVRGLFHAGGMMLWFAALPFVTLPELTAIGFTGPIFICLGATLFLGERMSGARWAAVLIGFSGVLLVVQPWAAGGFSGISRGVLLMLASAPVFAASFLVAKTLTRHDP